MNLDILESKLHCRADGGLKIKGIAVQQQYQVVTPFFTCALHWGLSGVKKKSREKVLSKNELHFRDQRIDISHRFNFEYYWYKINKENDFLKINNCG